jgi:hypothetical protein
VQLNEEFSNWVVDLFISLILQVINLKGTNPVIIYQGITIGMLKNMTNYASISCMLLSGGTINLTMTQSMSDTTVSGLKSSRRPRIWALTTSTST